MTELHTGETIWTMSAFFTKHEAPRAYVHRCTVLDGENKVVKQHWPSGHDHVVALGGVGGYGVSIHACEADAWLAAAAVFAKGAEELTAQAAECSQKAAACVVGEAVPA